MGQMTHDPRCLGMAGGGKKKNPGLLPSPLPTVPKVFFMILRIYKFISFKKRDFFMSHEKQQILELDRREQIVEVLI